MMPFTFALFVLALPLVGKANVPANIFLETNNSQQRLRVQLALQSLREYPVGALLLDEIAQSPHQLHIRHNPYSLSSVGKTLLPLTRKLSNGIGDNATIEMHLDIPEGGSHLVSECTKGWIPFSFLQNLAHELRHARDGMTGKFVGHRYEQDAVDTENQLRKEMGIQEQRCLQENEENVLQIWWPKL